VDYSENYKVVILEGENKDSRICWEPIVILLLICILAPVSSRMFLAY
jgi:hypothetical protein